MEAFFRIRGGGQMGFGRGFRGPPPKLDPFPDANLLLLAPGGEVEFTGEEEPPPELLGWLEAVRANPALSDAASEMGQLVDGLANDMRECMGGDRPGRGPDMGFRRSRTPEEADARGACREILDAARISATERATQLAWPQQVASTSGGNNALQTAVLVRLPDEDQPHALALESSLDSIHATTQALSRGVMFGGPLLLAIVAGIAWYLVGRSFRVVGDIQREVEQIAFGTLDRRLEEPRTKDEVSRLVVTLNRMLDRVAGGARRQREFIGDASHELRSPIASIRTQLEVALSHPEAADWPQVAAGANEEAIRMQRLVDDLLRIAGLDESPNGPAEQKQEIDLDDIVRAESALRDAPIGLSDVSPVRVWGVEQDLRRIVRNLLENAQRYGAGRIEVSLSRTEREARLEIEDDGPGVPPERREFVFGRFTRLDESRSRAGGGAGLGLSLARGLARAHGGEIRIEEARIGGARLVLTLPVDAATPAA